MNGSGSKGHGCEWPCSNSRLPASHKAPFIAWKYCQNRAADFPVILQTWANTGGDEHLTMMPLVQVIEPRPPQHSFVLV